MDKKAFYLPFQLERPLGKEGFDFSLSLLGKKFYTSILNICGFKKEGIHWLGNS